MAKRIHVHAVRHLSPAFLMLFARQTKCAFAICHMRPDGDHFLTVASTGLLEDADAGEDYYALQCACANMQLSRSWYGPGHLDYL